MIYYLYISPSCIHPLILVYDVNIDDRSLSLSSSSSSSSLLLLLLLLLLFMSIEWWSYTFPHPPSSSSSARPQDIAKLEEEQQRQRDLARFGRAAASTRSIKTPAMAKEMPGHGEGHEKGPGKGKLRGKTERKLGNLWKNQGKIWEIHGNTRQNMENMWELWQIYGLEPRKNSENKEILGGFLHADNGESKKDVGLIDEIGGLTSNM